MTKRKIFKNGEKLTMLIWFHFETFTYSYDYFIKHFITKIPEVVYPHMRSLLIEIDSGYWVEMVEYQDRMTIGFSIEFQGVMYDMPSKKETKTYIDRYAIEQSRKNLKKYAQVH